MTRIARRLAPVAALALLCAFGAGWKPFVHAKGNFSVMMPGTPKESTSVEQTKAGPIELYQAGVVVEPKAYFVSYSDMPRETWRGDVKKMLQGARDGSAKRVNGTVLSDREIRLAGKYPGIEFRVAVGEGESRMVMTQRAYLVKHRLYQLNMGCMADRCTDAEVQEYLDSFKLLGPAK